MKEINGIYEKDGEERRIQVYDTGFDIMARDFDEDDWRDGHIASAPDLRDIWGRIHEAGFTYVGPFTP